MCSDEVMERKLNHLKQSISNGNNYLIYGNDSTIFLKQVYEFFKTEDKFRATYHDESLVQTPRDFLEPILMLKYHDYDSWKEELWAQKKSGLPFFDIIIDSCGQEKDSDDPVKRKKPLIFIDGIENLLYKLDLYALSEEKQKEVIDSGKSDNLFHFSSALRAALCTPNKGNIVGVVNNFESIEYKFTLGTYHYLLNADNFGHIVL
jgi:hypothetical protein